MPSTSSIAQSSSDDFLCTAPEEVYDMVMDHGFARISSGIDGQELDAFNAHLETLEDRAETERGPYDKTRYSLNGHPDLDHRFYDRMLDTPVLQDCLDRLLPGWERGRYGGDRAKAKAQSHQALHSDWPDYTSMKFGLAVCVSLALVDVPAEYGAIRCVPWSCRGYGRPPYPDVDENGHLAGLRLSMRRGEFLLRDCRAAHAGAPNDYPTIDCRMSIVECRVRGAVDVGYRGRGAFWGDFNHVSASG